jgi:acetyl-CoA/propionyl-CoA carboxylase biotin carboxyl carrier protein
MTVPQAFDSLLAKLIVTGADRRQALERARRALAEFEVGGMPTVLPFHQAVVDDPAFTAEPFSVHTRWIETEFSGSIPPFSGQPAPAGADGTPDGEPPRERITVEVQGKRLEVVLPAGLAMTGAPAAQRPAGERAGRPGRSRRSGRSGAAQASGDVLTCPMQGTIVKIVAEEGQRVSAGDTVVVLEAMKMEQPLTAHKDGTVTGMAVTIGQAVAAGDAVCQLKD